MTSTIIDLSGNEAAHILTVSALYTQHTDLPTPPSLPKPRYRCCLPSTTSVGHPRNLLRTASKHRASRLESPAPYLVFPLYTHTHTHLQDGVKEEGPPQGTAALDWICFSSLMRAGHYPRRQRGRQDELDEPICTNNPSLSYIRRNW